LAKKGHAVAMKLCLERIYPAPKDRPVSFPLRPIQSAHDAADALADLANAASTGRITPSDAEAMARVLGHAVKAFEVAEVAERATDPRRLSTDELYRIIEREERAREVSAAQQSPKLLTLNPR
jgi:hypothetical protein